MTEEQLAVHVREVIPMNKSPLELFEQVRAGALRTLDYLGIGSTTPITVPKGPPRLALNEYERALQVTLRLFIEVLYNAPGVVAWIDHTVVALARRR